MTTADSAPSILRVVFALLLIAAARSRAAPPAETLSALLHEICGELAKPAPEGRTINRIVSRATHESDPVAATPLKQLPNRSPRPQISLSSISLDEAMLPHQVTLAIANETLTPANLVPSLGPFAERKIYDGRAEFTVEFPSVTVQPFKCRVFGEGTDRGEGTARSKLTKIVLFRDLASSDVPLASKRNRPAGSEDSANSHAIRRESTRPPRQRRHHEHASGRGGS